MCCIQYKDYSDQDECFYVEGGGQMVSKNKATVFTSKRKAVKTLNLLKLHNVNVCICDY